MTASGCVTVHGEREIVPSATKAEAARALKDFTTAYNKADKAYDPALDAGRVTGALGQINQAGLKARRVNNKDGNPKHRPMEWTDAEFHIPKQAGWPRWFIADTDSNTDRDGQERYDTRWLFVFTRGGPDQLWEVSYLSIVTPDEIPEFKTDADGWAEPVEADGPGLATAPKDLSKKYAAYLQDGGDEFGPGAYTTSVLEYRKKYAKRPGKTRQWIDEPLNSGDFAPVALRTKDGGALVFFSGRYFEKQTARGVPLDINVDEKALMTGEATNSVLKEQIGSQSVKVAPKGKSEPIVFLNSIKGLVSAKGE
ncbi:hypothetical protein P8605_30865 [Streptomyces sp. T-3]|nr:hypothetical protein [Streptomyces sp. T-3]